MTPRRDDPDVFDTPPIKRMGGMLTGEILLAINHSEQACRLEWQNAIKPFINDLSEVKNTLKQLNGDGLKDEGSIERGFCGILKRMEEIDARTKIHSSVIVEAASMTAKSAMIVARSEQDIQQAQVLNDHMEVIKKNPSLAEGTIDFVENPETRSFAKLIARKVIAPFWIYVWANKIKILNEIFKIIILLAILGRQVYRAIYPISNTRDIVVTSHDAQPGAKPTTSVTITPPDKVPK